MTQPTMTTAEATARPSDPYRGRSQETGPLLGAVGPNDPPGEERGMTPQQQSMLMALSETLAQQLATVHTDFWKDRAGFTFEERTQVMMDATASLVATWSCSEEAARHSTYDLPTSIQLAVEFLQHNFMNKQKGLYSRHGRFVH